MADVQNQHRLACGVRRLVEEKYTWQRAVALLEGAYRLAVGSLNR